MKLVETQIQREKRLAGYRRYYLLNRKKMIARNWRASHPKRYKRINLDSQRRQKYGPGAVELYEKLKKKQKGRCAICKRRKKLQQDHCHVSKRLRLLLCGSCNRGIGLLQDSHQVCLSASKYLRRFS